MKRRLQLAKLWQTSFLLSSMLLIMLISQHMQGYAATSPDEQSVRTSISEAKRLQQKAADLGYEWTTIEPLIEAANLNLSSGELDLALIKAEEAKAHAVQAIQQAKDQAQNWQLELPPK